MKQQVGLSKSVKIAQTLEREIRSGQLAKGHQLASENDLVRRFSVSRNTVRKGLEELARQGLITTRTGIGSFVTYDGTSIDNALGWTLALSKSDQCVETRLLRLERGADPDVKRFLACPDDDFLCVDRLRFDNESGIGISLERSRVPWRPDFIETMNEGLIEGSLNETLAKAGLVVDHGEERGEVLLSLSDVDADLMRRRSGEPMLRLRRVTRNREDDIVEYVESLLDPTRFGLHLEFGQ